VLFRSSRKKEPAPPQLGFRSRLVLAKLGYDLREHYDAVVAEAVPEDIERPLARLRGPDPVTRLDDRRPR
jgi:hypothetical protein